MIETTSEDETLTLEQDAWAIVWSPGQGWRLLIPAKDMVPPDEATAILGAFLRLSEDVGFQGECAEYALENHQDDSETVH